MNSIVALAGLQRADPWTRSLSFFGVSSRGDYAVVGQEKINKILGNYQPFSTPQIILPPAPLGQPATGRGDLCAETAIIALVSGQRRRTGIELRTRDEDFTDSEWPFRSSRSRMHFIGGGGGGSFSAAGQEGKHSPDI